MSDTGCSGDPGSATEATGAGSPFRIDLFPNSPVPRTLLRPSVRLLERVLFLDHLERLYQSTKERGGGEHFLIKLLEEMNVSYEISPEDMARLPKSGKIVVVANHPYGGIEAVIMRVILRGVRPDHKVLSNYLLSKIPEVSDDCIFVDPFGTKEGLRRNIAAMKEARELLKTEKGMLGVFPAGEVSHVSLRNRGVMDSPWNANIGRIIRMTESPVVPMFFEGHNGPFFQVAGMIHPRLRTAMLPHELVNKRDRSIRVLVGHRIPFEKLDSHATDADMMEYLRFRTYMLGNRDRPDAKIRPRHAAPTRQRRDEEIASPENPALMQAEIEHLPADAKLAENKGFTVYVARAEQIRHIVHEIGRLREITFRREREGTGKSRDLDRFDARYLHLFVWRNETCEVVGAYRMGPTDRIVEAHGKRGLYTSTLFKYRKSLLNRLGPSLELGRSFVRPEYQKDYSPLLLLWKGIGQYVVANPQYANLFGPVSISNKYRSVSRQLLAAYLKVNNFQTKLARMIRAKKPLRPRRIRGCASTIFDHAVKDLDTISSVIAEIEGKNRGVPILVKQYLRMGGRLLGFNMDPDFSDVLDGLMLVDLRQTDRAQLKRFMTADGMSKFLAWHGIDDSDQKEQGEG